LGVGLVAAVLSARPHEASSAKVVVDARSQAPFGSCLLTDQGGVGRAPASQVWAGMQDAAAATNTRASFLPVVGKASTKNAVTYLNTLFAEHCAVVAAVGTAPVAAVTTAAGAHSGTRFVVLGAVASPPSNVTVIPSDHAREQARALVVQAAGVR
jgi:hypothetical protein